MEKKVYKYSSANTVDMYFTNLKKAYGFYQVNTVKSFQVSYSTIANSIKQYGEYVTQHNFLSIEKITVE